MMEKWRRRDRAGLGAEGYCFHELRHSYLTALVRAGVHPKVMQELAGHVTSAITMDIYTHVNMDSKREAAEALRQSMAAVQAAQEDAQPEEPRESPAA